MALTFTCPHCGKHLLVHEDRIGESGPCAECGAPVSVPDPNNRFAGAAQGDRLQFRFNVWNWIFGCGFILLIIAFLIPSISPTHRRSRRISCASNLKQVGLALYTYHDVHQSFPLASSQPFVGQPGSSSSPHPAGYSWVVPILPFLDENALYNQWKLDSNDFQLGPFDRAIAPENLNSHIPLLLCPLSNAKQVDIDNSEYQLLNSPNGSLGPARSCYVAFAASHFTNTRGPGQLFESDPNSPFDGNGVFPFPKSSVNHQRGIRIADITDGASNTALLCESKEMAYAAWFDGQAMWAVGAWPGSANIPKPNGALDGQLGWPDNDEQSRASIQTGSDSDPAETYLPASRYHAQYNRRWGPSSDHDGVVNHLFADGSVRPIDSTIDRNLYLRLISRDGSEMIDLTDIE